MSNKGYIYYIKNTKTNKYYIGLTRTDITTRINKHFNCLKHNNHHSKKLQNSYNKHGKENFIHGVLYSFDDISNEDLGNLEKETILKYDSVDNGYNVQMGGYCSKSDIDMIKVTSESHIGQKSPMRILEKSDVFLIYSLVGNLENICTELGRLLNISKSVVLNICRENYYIEYIEEYKSLDENDKNEIYKNSFNYILNEYNVNLKEYSKLYKTIDDKTRNEIALLGKYLKFCSTSINKIYNINNSKNTIAKYSKTVDCDDRKFINILTENITCFYDNFYFNIDYLCCVLIKKINENVSLVELSKVFEVDISILRQTFKNRRNKNAYNIYKIITVEEALELLKAIGNTEPSLNRKILEGVTTKIYNLKI